MDAKRISELRRFVSGEMPWGSLDSKYALSQALDEIERLQKLCDDYYRQCHKCSK